jgi:hypothetical protein
MVEWKDSFSFDSAKLEKLDPKALAKAYELVPAVYWRHPRDQLIKGKPGYRAHARSNANSWIYDNVVSAVHVAAPAIISIREANDCVQHVIDQLDNGIVATWLDLFETIPPGHVRVLDTRTGRARARLLGRSAKNNLYPLWEADTSRYTTEFPGFYFWQWCGGLIRRKGAETDTAILFWYRPPSADANETRAALRIERRYANNWQISPSVDVLREILAHGELHSFTSPRSYNDAVGA